MLPTFLRARFFGANPLLYLILRLVAFVSMGSSNSLHMAGVSAFSVLHAPGHVARHTQNSAMSQDTRHIRP